LDPVVLADGVGYEEAVKMNKETREAVESLQELQERLKAILERVA
jgi:hypothetical protein